MSIKTGVIVLAHGSKVRTGNEGLFTIVEMLRAMGKWDMVEPGFLQLAKPGLTEVVEVLVDRGAKRVVVMPLLLFSGNHVLKDIPEEIDIERKKFPDVEFCYAKNIGADERIAMIVSDRVDESVNQSPHTIEK
jgi:precorrin-8X/cobalt-precorrin-8 methylmutase